MESILKQPQSLSPQTPQLSTVNPLAGLPSQPVQDELSPSHTPHTSRKEGEVEREEEEEEGLDEELVEDDGEEEEEEDDGEEEEEEVEEEEVGS